MHGCIYRRLSVVLAATAVLTGTTLAWGQHSQSMVVPNDPAYALAADSAYAMPKEGVAGHTFSATGYRTPPGLADRLANVEAELAKMKAKSSAEKKKKAGRPSMKAGGRIQWDFACFDQDANSLTQIGNQLDGTEFRRARIYIKGGAFHVIDYKIQMDFADTNKANQGQGAGFHQDQMIQSTAFKDVYITVKELPWVGHIRVGHFKEPVGLEQLTSARWLTFMERSLADENAFVPARNAGVMAFNTFADEMGTWAIGGFVSEQTAEPPVFRSDNGGLALTMRGTYLPWYDEATDGRGLLHTGISYSYRDMSDGTARFRQRPESHLADYFVDTDNIDNVPCWHVVGIESALVYGPFSAQAEWFGAFVERTAGLADPTFNGVYAYVSYFLTGEHRPYKQSGGVFDRIRPHENFFRVRAEDGNVYTGKGAWEVAYRFSYIDLNDGGILGGRAADHTIGLNWYLNPYTRMMFNYVNSSLYRGGLEGNMDIVEMRAQIDF